MTANRRLTSMAGNRVAFGSVTNSYTALLTGVPGSGVILVITNSLNGDVWISLDGGTTDFVALPSGQGLTLDLSANDGEFSGTVSVKYIAQPTAGAICAGIVRVK